MRIILLNGLEMEALRFSHACARMNRALQANLAQLRRVEQHQATTVNWLIGADHSPLETTIAYEQVAIDITAAVAMREPEPYDRASADAREMQQIAETLPADAEAAEQGLASLRRPYIEESEGLGSVPLPATMKGAASAVMQALTGDRAHVLIDKLGERLAFERGGVRLY